MTAGCSPDSSPPNKPAASGPPLPELLTPDRANQQRLHNPAGLVGFFAGLARLESQSVRQPLRILQIGDSHSANDGFSGRLREALQARFGAAGRGWLPIGMPFKYFNPRLVSVDEAGWRHLGGLKPPPSLPLGLDGGVAESTGTGAWMTLSSGEPAGFDRLAIEILAHPAGGVLSVQVDGRPPVRIETAAPRTEARRIEIASPPHAHEVSLKVLGRRSVRLLGWAAERRQPGIIYENHGTIGATVAHLGKFDAGVVAQELADSRPTLIVVAFGTNEGFDDALDRQHYPEIFRASVEALRRQAPQASVLVLGPPDGNRLDTACDGAPGTAAGCASEDADEAACTWRPPPSLDPVRRAQRRVAAAQGWAFWDWSQAMGGACSIHRLVSRDPPWAFPDHVHLTRLGYAATADVLFYDLAAAYQKWQRGQAPPQAVSRAAEEGKGDGETGQFLQ
jgi:lysophospholipase L1-like esterase